MAPLNSIAQSGLTLGWAFLRPSVFRQKGAPMIHIRNMQDLSAIQDDPELSREVASTILYCRYEMLNDQEKGYFYCHHLYFLGPSRSDPFDALVSNYWRRKTVWQFLLIFLILHLVCLCNSSEYLMFFLFSFMSWLIFHDGWRIWSEGFATY